MKNIRIVKGNITRPKKAVDLIVFQSLTATDLSFNKSNYENSQYCIYIPKKILNEENVLEYLEYYERAVKIAKNKRLTSIAVEAIDLGDEGYNFSLAIEFARVLEDAIGLTVGITPIKITIICPTRALCEIYETAIFGEIQSAQITMTDKLEQNDVILIPTEGNIFKFDKNYKKLKKKESRLVFWHCFKCRNLAFGEHFLVKGDKYSDYYFFANMKQYQKSDEEKFEDLAIKSVINVMNAADVMSCKNITVPVIQFMRKEKNNEEFVKKYVDAVCEHAEELEMKVKFFCVDEDLWDIVLNCFDD